MFNMTIAVYHDVKDRVVQRQGQIIFYLLIGNVTCFKISLTASRFLAPITIKFSSACAMIQARYCKGILRRHILTLLEDIVFLCQQESVLATICSTSSRIPYGTGSYSSCLPPGTGSCFSCLFELPKLEEGYVVTREQLFNS